MRNWVKGLVAAAAATGLLVGPAAALSGSIVVEGVVISPAPASTCAVDLKSQAVDRGYGQVFMYDVTAPNTKWAAGGSLWYDGFHDTVTFQAIDISKVETCLGAGTGSVTNFSASGADGANYSVDSYIGFSFDYAGNHYEYAVSGATNTQLITSVTAIDTTAPTVTSVSVPANATYAAAQNLDFTVNANEAVTVNTSGGTPYIALTIGSTSLQASYLSGSGTSALVFRYTVQSGDLDSDGITVGALSANGGTLRDAAGNDMTLTLNSVGATSAVLVDTASPTVVVTGPSGPITGPFTATFTFSETVTGFAANDINITNGTIGSVTGAGASYSVQVTPTLGATVSISVPAAAAQDAAQNQSVASNVFTVQSGSPGSAFAAAEAEIRDVITKDATRSLQSGLAFNQQMTKDARGRFIAGQDRETLSTSNVPFDVDGSFDTTSTTISSMGTFFGQTGLGSGARRLVFGDFDVQHDSETGSSTATLNGKIAWEKPLSGKTLLGYFIGGELARSNIMGGFDGNQNRAGLNVGGYAVHELAHQVYLDGFVSFGLGRNNLTMSNGVLDLDSDYSTRMASLGATLSGVIEQQGFEIWPELSFSYGRTWLGNIGFTGTAYSVTDNTLSLDAGTVTLANILFRPEFRVPMDGLSGAESQQVFTFAPRLICEQITTSTVEENCGGGAEVGLAAQSVDGLSNVSAKIMADRLGGRTNSSLQLNLQHQF